MDNNYTNTELLIKYLDGDLPAEQAKELEKKIKEDEALQRELESLEISVGVVKLYGLQNKVSSMHSAMMKELSQEQPVPRIGRSVTFIKNTMKIAATVIVILGSIFLYEYLTLSPQSLFQNNFEAYTVHENRGSEKQSALEQPYKLSDYDTVISLFRHLAFRTIADYFIAGNAYLDKGNSAEAIKCFLAVQQMNTAQQTHLYEDDTEYYLAMSYLQHGESAKAYPLLEKIHGDKSHLYHDKVSSWLLRKLHWIHS